MFLPAGALMGPEENTHNAILEFVCLFVIIKWGRIWADGYRYLNKMQTIELCNFELWKKTKVLQFFMLFVEQFKKENNNDLLPVNEDLS